MEKYEQVVRKAIDNLTYQLVEFDRELLILRGKIEAYEAMKANLTQWVNNNEGWKP